MITIVPYPSSLGSIIIKADDDAVISMRFAETMPGEAANSTTRPTNHAIIAEVFHWLDTYFSGKKPDFMPSILLRGTTFQLKVWHELMNIPYGHTTTYGQLGRLVGCRSAQAVGGAVGQNPMAILVPCHRVVGADGGLTGYAYGIDRKQKLIELENPTTT